MQKTEDLNEIEEFGAAEDFEHEPQVQQRQGYSILPLLQTACCALLLVALLFLKYQDAPKYHQVTTWYREAAAEEIELPRFQNSLQQTENGAGEHSLSSAPGTSAENSREEQAASDWTAAQRV